MVVVVVTMGMVGAVRTGRRRDHSAAWLPWVAAAVLAQQHAPPHVARQLAQFLGQRHGLIEIGEEVAGGRSVRHGGRSSRWQIDAQAGITRTEHACFALARCPHCNVWRERSARQLAYRTRRPPTPRPAPTDRRLSSSRSRTSTLSAAPVHLASHMLSRSPSGKRCVLASQEEGEEIVFGLFRRDYGRDAAQQSRGAARLTPAAAAERLTAFIRMTSGQASILPENKAMLERMLAHPPLWHHHLSQADLQRVAARDAGDAGDAEKVAAPPSLAPSAVMVPPAEFPAVWSAYQELGGMLR